MYVTVLIGMHEYIVAVMLRLPFLKFQNIETGMNGFAA